MQNRLRIYRAQYGEHGISQIELARRTGMNRQRYWLVEREHAEPTDAEIAALERELDTPRALLFPPLADQQQAVSR